MRIDKSRDVTLYAIMHVCSCRVPPTHQRSYRFGPFLRIKLWKNRSFLVKTLELRLLNVLSGAVGAAWSVRSV